jgi:hypothetical protein
MEFFVNKKRQFCVCYVMRHLNLSVGLGLAKKREHKLSGSLFPDSILALYVYDILNGRRKLTAHELKYLNEVLDVQTRLLFLLGAQTYLHTCI